MTEQQYEHGNFDLSYLKPKNPPLGPIWMLTFADLLSLILTFFVLMYSMSALEQQQWYQVKQSFFQRLNPDQRLDITPATAKKTLAILDTHRALDLDYLSNVIAEKIGNTPELSEIRLQHLGDRLVISLVDDALFEQGSSRLSVKAISLMFFLEGILYSIGNTIEIHGHADPTPIRGDNAANWELSLTRAITVAEELKKSGYQYTIRSFGLADSRYGDIAPSSTAAEKAELHRLARRVDIVIRAEPADQL